MSLTLANAFTQADIAAAINVIPNTYGRINSLGIMPVRGVTTRDIAVEEQNGTLSLIPTEALGGQTVSANGKRKVRLFRAPRLTHDGFVSPQDVDGLRAFGGVTQASLSGLLAQKLANARAKHDITLEHLRMGALKGIIMDADGTTPIYNLFTEFGVSQLSANILDTAGTAKPLTNCLNVVRTIEDNLMGDTMTNVHALLSPELFDLLVTNANVKEAYAGYQEAAQRLGGDMRKGFVYGGITFEEYRARATGSAGSSVRFIAAGEGIAFPVGTRSTFATLAAPADFNDTVGTLGQVYYARVAEGKFGRGYDIHTQANVLPLCMRPSVLVKLTGA